MKLKKAINKIKRYSPSNSKAEYKGFTSFSNQDAACQGNYCRCSGTVEGKHVEKFSQMLK